MLDELPEPGGVDHHAVTGVDADVPVSPDEVSRESLSGLVQGVHLAGITVPEYRPEALTHIGNLDPASKGTWSLEGQGLSVSRHPEAWGRITRLGGPVWTVGSATPRFLDFHELTEQQEESLVEWGIERSYEEKKPVWRVTTWDDELGCDRWDIFTDEAEADDEAEYSEGEVSPTISIVATDAFPDATVKSGATDVEELLATVWVEEEATEFDGVRWEDDYDPARDRRLGLIGGTVRRPRRRHRGRRLTAALIGGMTTTPKRHQAGEPASKGGQFAADPKAEATTELVDATQPYRDLGVVGELTPFADRHDPDLPQNTVELYTASGRVILLSIVDGALNTHTPIDDMGYVTHYGSAGASSTEVADHIATALSDSAIHDMMANFMSPVEDDDADEDDEEMYELRDTEYRVQADGSLEVTLDICDDGTGDYYGVGFNHFTEEITVWNTGEKLEASDAKNLIDRIGKKNVENGDWVAMFRAHAEAVAADVDVTPDLRQAASQAVAEAAAE